MKNLLTALLVCALALPLGLLSVSEKQAQALIEKCEVPSTVKPLMEEIDKNANQFIAHGENLFRAINGSSGTCIVKTLNKYDGAEPVKTVCGSKKVAHDVNMITQAANDFYANAMGIHPKLKAISEDAIQEMLSDQQNARAIAKKHMTPVMCVKAKLEAAFNKMSKTEKALTTAGLH